jgi:hypothetical protein
MGIGGKVTGKGSLKVLIQNTCPNVTLPLLDCLEIELSCCHKVPTNLLSSGTGWNCIMTVEELVSGLFDMNNSNSVQNVVSFFV